jgi:hypothetical protein
MKKFIVIVTLLLGIGVAANAQPRALGVRGGYGVELSYQHTLGAHFLEADLGLYTSNAINLGATYNFILAQPNWTSKGEWGVYAGPGAVVGLGFGANSGVTVAAAGQVGLEYSFWFPLQLSIDIRPQLGVAAHNQGANFYFGGFYPTLGIRYRF